MNKPNRTIQQEYEATRRRVARMSKWLTGPKAEALPEADWNDRFTRYQEELTALRRLGELLRPAPLRERRPVETAYTDHIWDGGDL